MTGSKTCTQCRARKVKCDGTSPQCGPCSRSRRPSNECIYQPADLALKPHQGSLRKGAACLTCRKKKRRCDGKRPVCTTCSSNGRDYECYYDTRASQDNNTTDAPRFGPVPSTSSITPDSNREWSDSDQSRSTSHTPQQSFLEPSFVGNNYPNTSSPTSFDYPNSFYRETFLSHLVQIGIYLTPAKRHAISYGDMTSTVIHPFFIHASHLFGQHLHQGRRRTTSGTSNQLHLDLALDCISNVGPDAYAQAGAYCLISLFYLWTQNLDLADRYLCEAAEVVQMNQLGLDLPSIEGESDEVKEKVSLLAQLVYVENYLYLVMNVPPKHFLHLERQLLSVIRSSPEAASSPVVVRTRAIMLVREACQLKASFNRSEGLTYEWVHIFKRLISSFSDHITDTAPYLPIIETPGDRETFVTLKYSIVVCMTAEAELHQLFASAGQPQAAQICRDTLAKVARMTVDLTEEELDLLDPFLEMCLTRAMTKFNPGVLQPRPTPYTIEPGQQLQGDFVRPSISVVTSSSNLAPFDPEIYFPSTPLFSNTPV